VTLSLTPKWDSEESRVILPSQCAVAGDLPKQMQRSKISIRKFLSSNYSQVIQTELCSAVPRILQEKIRQAYLSEILISLRQTRLPVSSKIDFSGSNVLIDCPSN
jgi:hypothetical protein